VRIRREERWSSKVRKEKIGTEREGKEGVHKKNVRRRMKRKWSVKRRK
jgi:hypothetical protein